MRISPERVVGDCDDDRTLDCEWVPDDTGGTAGPTNSGNDCDAGHFFLISTTAVAQGNRRSGYASSSRSGTADWLLLLGPLRRRR